MGTATRKAMARNAQRQAMDAMIVRKVPEGSSAAVRMQIEGERQAARKARKAMANSWAKREQKPGNFHRPNGKAVMPARNDAR